ncbi:MAG: ABC transporter ATP-binding protein [Methylobacteriaceae bacterium]|nr:ABC transporter ATP-binding protein [Methylobacteriaceae bacterium]MBV9220348.1 ABC transporter ATP-binding protein [Methylobacteriaceae bacterium]MBV9245858.1 ABC transporter ATP-binding protein [Methylobacteriaceae bacterium]MBV9635143.1 ABC transporter ATP-binding protein [Methylobacteriaceae bacterium]
MSLTLQGVSVDLGRRRVLSDIDLSVPTGSFVGLLGPNGSGKSALLKAIYRAHRPATGRVLVDGRDLLAMPPREAARRVAAVAQDAAVEFGFTVRELVMVGRTPHKGLLDADDENDHAAVKDAIERVGCAHLAQRPFNTLSGGEKQRVLIARAIAQGADHLILDEPTNQLDIRYQIQVLEIAAGLGVTVLAALHDLSLAALFCEEVHILLDGRIVEGGPPRNVVTAELVRRVYAAEVLVIPHPEHGTPHLLPRRAPSAAVRFPT